MISKPREERECRRTKLPPNAQKADGVYQPAPDHDLLNSFTKWFDIVPANTPELLRDAYALRYQVYCVENPFEDPADHPDGLETDEYDSHSVHSLLVHRERQEVAGTVRLVLPVVNGPDLELPISSVCDRKALEQARFPRAATAEISRFSISKAFRRRASDQATRAAQFGELQQAEQQRVIPNIAFGLFRAVVEMSHQKGITHLCAVMEPSLLRLLGRFGFHFDALGPLVDYHGRRQPCHADLDVLLTGLGLRRPDAIDLVTGRGKFWAKPELDNVA
jgi:N-acyl amino acid synthase of PEP-CTERM/exosortase system